MGGGRSSENNAIRSLPASKNRRPRFLPERDVKANFTNFRLKFPKISWSMLCCPICNKINQYIYASRHTHYKCGCLLGSTSAGLEFWLFCIRQNLESPRFTVTRSLKISLSISLDSISYVCFSFAISFFDMFHCGRFFSPIF